VRQGFGVDAAGHRAEPEAGPAGEDADAVARSEVAQRLERVRPEVGDRERLVGIDEVDAVVDDSSALLDGRLRGADVEPAVDLAGVGRDDLGGRASRDQSLGERDREARLASRSRAADDDQRGECRRRVASPRRAAAQASVPRSA
jgi:hypothetical protein